MDLLKIILDPEGLRKTCFLCFNLCDSGTSLYDVIDVQDESLDFDIKTSLINIIQYLFPFQDILFSTACNDCIQDLKKIYCKFQLRSINIENLIQIVDLINKNISEKTPESKISISIPIVGKHTNSQEILQNSQKNDNKNFTPKAVLQEHNLITNTKSQSKMCHICGKHCKNPKALKSHLNSHNRKQCPYCQKVLKTHSHFNKHVKSHTTNLKRKRNRNSYFCDSCSYETKNKTDLESHYNKMHLKVRPYQCETCSKSFYKKSNLTAHLSTHNNSRELICELCGSDFSVKKTLIQHLKLHEGTRDYECAFCKRKFVTQSRRNEHVKRNHSDQCYKCPYCEKKYTLKKDMKSHLKRAHECVGALQLYICKI